MDNFEKLNVKAQNILQKMKTLYMNDNARFKKKTMKAKYRKLYEDLIDVDNTIDLEDWEEEWKEEKEKIIAEKNKRYEQQHKAVANEHIMEEEYNNTLKSLSKQNESKKDKAINELDKVLKQSKSEDKKDKAINELDKVLKQSKSEDKKNKAINELDKVFEQSKQNESKKDKAINELDKVLKQSKSEDKQMRVLMIRRERREN